MKHSVVQRQCMEMEKYTQLSHLSMYPIYVHVRHPDYIVIMKFFYFAASVGVISRTFRKLWSTVKVREAIFSRFCMIRALRAYIRPWNFLSNSSNSFDTSKNGKKCAKIPHGVILHMHWGNLAHLQLNLLESQISLITLLHKSKKLNKLSGYVTTHIFFT